MTAGGKRLVLVAVVAFIAALLGVFAGRLIYEQRHESESELHAVLHRELSLDAAQEAKIDVIEKSFAAHRSVLDLQMKAANARLAAAIETEHGYGPQVTAAVDQVHHVMGEMQKDTLQHIFAMRAVLTSKQAAKFDRTVVQALAPDRR